MTSKKVLITGGSGFLGNHLSRLLIEKGYSVTVLDKVKSSTPGVKFIKGDFNDHDLVTPILRECDGIFHLAAVVGVDYCSNNPQEVGRVNIDNTISFFKLCLKQRVKRIIFTSSSEVYGSSVDIPYREDSLLQPVSIYGQGKVLVEEYIKSIAKQTETTFGVVRPFNVYGPAQRVDFVVPIFIHQAMANKPVQVFGHGNQTRCFTHVNDIVEGIIKLYEYSKTPLEIVNLGKNQEFSINQLAQLVLDSLPESTSKIVHKKYGHQGVREVKLEITRRVPAINQAMDLLGYEAKTTLKEGLVETINYYQSQTDQL